MSNFRRKAFTFIVVLVFWAILFNIINVILKDKLVYHMTINNYLSFSYPLGYEIDDIYVNKLVRENFIETNSSLKTAIIQNYSHFQSETGNFGFSYPTSFILSQKDFSGSDILYHIDFHSESGNSHGFVQVWNLPYSLKDFLIKSKAASLQNFINFSTKPITINKLPGYVWDYTLRTGDGKLYKSMEVFLKKDNRMYRVSYFTPASLWNKEQSDIFWSIVNSLRFNP